MRIMLSCGEPSGDLYAGALVAELLAREPSAEVSGFGGRRLAAAGARLIGDFEGLSVTGLTEAIRVLPRSFAMLRRLTAAARDLRPDVFVAIDFPDFNFRLMAKVHALGIPVVYYISPQLWAWRAGRMQTMKRFVTRVLVIFPFEEPLYRNAGVPVEFVGHPLVDLVQVRQPRAELLRERGLDPAVPTVALLPGSRPNELRRIVPGMAAALPLIRARVPSVQFLVAAAPNLPDTLFAPLLDAGAGAVGRPALVRERTDDVLAASDVVVTASGTATVQAALHERPMVVVYRLSPLTYRLGKPFVRVDTYAMANLVAGRRIVPELIQEDFTAERVATETVRFLTDGELHARTREELRRVRARLGDRGASGRAADAVLAVARTHNLRR
ncbi:MAG TPA: lipid-A-disaccharide synthase [Vicinamibacterales bacterium]|jgi:lipid-A-disaccharide synthase|nr:lipid-A-disaccharide synthase [Vicinamibacterales bacterium]